MFDKEFALVIVRSHLFYLLECDAWKHHIEGENTRMLHNVSGQRLP
jgi:hypothetical protein